MSDERKPMTDEELDAIKGRLAAITPQPWMNQFGVIVAGEKTIAVAWCAGEVTREEQATNAAFIANTPTDIARLLAEVERLEKEADWLDESLDIITRYCVPEVINELKYKSWREAARKAVEEKERYG